MTFDQVPWLALCVGLTAMGVVLTWTVGRRRGAAATLRGLAWSLLPVAAYLTGTVEVLWRMGTAVSSWVVGFVFDISSWIGVGVAGLAVVLFLVSSAMYSRAASAGRSAGAKPASTDKHETTRLPSAPGQQRRQMPPSQPETQPMPKQQEKKKEQQPAASGDDEDFSDIEEILRRRGIS